MAGVGLKVAILQRQVRTRGEIGIRLGIAGQDDELDVVVLGQRLDLLEAIGPVAGAAEQAQHNQPGQAQGFVEIKVDGKIMLEVEEIGETQGGVFSGVIGPCQCGNLAVGGTQHHDIGG